MTQAEVERIIHHEPFIPFRLVLATGEEISVTHARKAHVSGPQIAVVGICKKPNGARFEKFQMVRVDQVVSAEMIKVS